MREWARFAIASVFVIGAWGCSSGGSSDTNLLDDGGADGTLGDGITGDGSSGDSPIGFDIGGETGCKKRTCTDAGANCGPVSDGCGGLLDCGKCTIPGEICGGGGKPSLCGTAPCTKKTCTDLGAECGKQGDGCGGLIDCGSCTAPATCGGGGVANKCGTSVPPCTPKTCTAMGINCGKNADGCGGIVDCGTCAAPDTCGGGGTFSVCGHTTSPCVAKTCAAYPGTCGVQSDGCGGLTPSCGSCTAPATCGGGGTASVCGGGPPPCTPKTCADFPGLCGPQSDGCGGLTASCGSCTAPETCGGGGVPSTCGGGPPPCVPKTCADYPGTCGPQSDGCGGLTTSCGSCTPPQSCGGGGVPGVCGGAPICTPKTCASYPGTCGPQSDGCGGLTTSCGTCTSPAICGGGGVPGVCGGGGGTTCVGLACKQVTCSSGTTSISGVVYDPAGNHPLPNVFVYVPNCPVGTFTAGVSCDKCSAALQGCPLVTTTTDVHGKFSLTNMPVDTNVPVVIQIGRWRRQITVTTSKCADVPVAATLTHLPRNKSEGDIPKIALTTGWADPLECLLRKIGIDDSEFTNPDGTGRVNLFEGQDDSATYGPGYTPTNSYDPTLGGAAFPNATQLWTQVAPNMSASPPIYGMSNYDVVLLGCEGSAVTSNKPDLTVMGQYTNIGGRVFAEHFHYTWVDFGPTPWPGLMTWRTGAVEYFENCYLTGTCSPLNETVLTTLTGGAAFPKGSMMNQWMQIVGAASATTPSLFPVNDARHSISTVNDTTNVIQWIQAPKAHASTATIFGTYAKGSTYTNMPEYVSFNTPVGAAPDSVCGRFVFSDIHVSSGDSVDLPFPQGCSTTTMTPQELGLEYMFFDLASRVCDETTPPPPPTCTPQTCASIGASCGAAPDGCGGTLSCGTCPSGSICSTGGKCASSPCTPATCSGLGHDCGSWPDGCGGTLSCGTCTPPASCGGTGIPGTCGGSSCTPTTCAALGHDCGSWSDGCGGTLNCGTCTPPATCGGGGVVGKCGGTPCTPTTCAALGYDCGSWADGCGGTLNCGTCTPPATCGGGGATGKCGAPPPCTPKTCATAGVSCGLAGDGCGGTIDCGSCDGGTPCVPLTCGGRCGPQGDGCGGVISCPACDGGVCTPTTCAAAGAECGSYPDGCGGLLDCGTCTAPATCGGGGVPNKCGSIK